MKVNTPVTSAIVLMIHVAQSFQLVTKTPCFTRTSLSHRECYPSILKCKENEYYATKHRISAVATTSRLLLSSILQDGDISTRTTTYNDLNKEKIIALQVEAEKLAYANHDDYAMNALFVNIAENPNPRPCFSNISAFPLDLPRGCLLRIGPNGAPEEEGFLDGDGMIHAITIPPKSIGMYSSTYVQTNGRKLEQQSIEKGNNFKFRGTLGSAPKGWKMLQNLMQNAIDFQTLSCQKDTCNTAMAQSGNRILALMEQSRPSEVTVDKNGKVTTIGSMVTLDGTIENAPITGGNFAAHGRTDPDTNERIHVSYNSNSKPFVKVDIFEENWKLKSSIDVDVPTPIMVHDCAITANYVVIFDFPLTIRPKRFLSNIFPVEYEPENGARIGLTKRSSDMNGEEVTQWFDVEPGVVLHLANGYENDDGHVVIHGARAVPKTDGSYIVEYSSSFLHEWILDPESNQVLVDRCLNPNEIVEFPAIEDRMVAAKSKYCYTLKTTGIGPPMKQFNTPKTGVLLDGLLKFSLLDDPEDGSSAGDVIGRFMLPIDWHFVSEPTVVNKTGDENEHYVLIIATEVPMDNRDVNHAEFALEKNAMRSQLMILDGNDISKGPCMTVDLPSHVNYGLHSLFVPWDTMV